MNADLTKLPVASSPNISHVPEKRKRRFILAGLFTLIGVGLLIVYFGWITQVPQEELALDKLLQADNEQVDKLTDRAENDLTTGRVVSGEFRANMYHAQDLLKEIKDARQKLTSLQNARMSDWDRIFYAAMFFFFLAAIIFLAEWAW